MNTQRTQAKLNNAQLADFFSAPLIDRHTGVIADCVETMIGGSDSKLFYFSALLPDISRYGNRQNCHHNNGGAGLTRADAKAAALGESVERYCCAFYNKEEQLYASYNDLKPNAIHPSQWALYSQNQHKKNDFFFQSFEENSMLYWVEAKSLISQRKVWVPSGFVYLPYIYDRNERIIAPSISTGLSAGVTWESAILGGLYEIIERDAITNMWLNKLSLPTINPFGDSRFFADILRKKIAVDRATYHLVDITNDIGIPVVFSVKLFQSQKGLSAACGAACRLDCEEAALKAVVESCQGAKWIEYLHFEDHMWGYKDDFSDITEFKNHIQLYSLPENLPMLEFVYQDNSQKDLSSMDNLSQGNAKDDLKYCLQLLDQKGFDPLIVDVTSSDIRDTGFIVVKILIPGALSLNGDHNYPFLGNKRLFELPSRMKLMDRLTTEDDLNPSPHPFP